jgi:hypothetical protein
MFDADEGAQCINHKNHASASTIHFRRRRRRRRKRRRRRRRRSRRMRRRRRRFWNAKHLEDTP